MKHNQLLEKIGSNGKYQYLSYALYSLEWMLAGFILLGVGFIFRKNDLDCFKSMDKDLCQNLVCNQPSDIWIRYVIEPQRSFRYQVNPPLMCDRDWIAGLIESSFYFSCCFGFMLFSHIGDNYGRKPVLIISWLTASLGCMLLAFAQSWQLMLIGLLLIGFGINPAITIHFSLISQQVVGNLKSLMMAGLQVVFALGQVLVAVVFMLILDARTSLIFFLAIPCLIFNWANLYIVESPDFLSNQSAQMALQAYSQIAAKNGKDDVRIEEIERREKLEKGQSSLLDLFRKENAVKSVIAGLTFFSIQTIYYGNNFILDKYGSNIYLNQIIIGSAQIIGYISSEFIVVSFNLKKYSVLGMLLSGLFCLVFALLTVPDDCDSCIQEILQLIFVFMLRFFLCSFWSVFYVYVAQIYQTDKRSIALGFVSLMGTLGSALAPQTQRLGKPMWLYMGIGLGCGLLMTLLPNLQKQNKLMLISQNQQSINE